MEMAPKGHCRDVSIFQVPQKKQRTGGGGRDQKTLEELSEWDIVVIFSQNREGSCHIQSIIELKLRRYHALVSIGPGRLT